MSSVYSWARGSFNYSRETSILMLSLAGVTDMVAAVCILLCSPSVVCIFYFSLTARRYSSVSD